MSTTKNNTLISSQDKRLSILSDLEEFAFYGFPDFDDELRLMYFEFSTEEIALIEQSPSLEAQVHAHYCLAISKPNIFFSDFLSKKFPRPISILSCHTISRIKP